MVGREEICGAMAYLTRALMTIADSNQISMVKINGEAVTIKDILQHSIALHKKLTKEMETVGGEEGVYLTRRAYIELAKKIEEAERVITQIDQAEQVHSC